MNHPKRAGAHEAFFRSVAKKESFRSLSGFVRRFMKRWVFAVETALISQHGEQVLQDVYKEEKK